MSTDGRNAADLVMYLEWAWGFLDSASFVRVRLSDEWSLYRGMESSFGMNMLLAATQHGVGADKEFLSYVFDEGGATADFEFILNVPTQITYPAAYSIEDLTGWISAGIAPHPDAIDTIVGTLEEQGLAVPYDEIVDIELPDGAPVPDEVCRPESDRKLTIVTASQATRPALAESV